MSRIQRFFILALLIMSFASQAQDTIIFRNGDELRVKVTEVSDTQLKYQLWDNQTGPIYVKNVSDIFMVKYKGGFKEVYGIAAKSNPVAQTNAAHPSNFSDDANVNLDELSGRIERSGNKLLLNGCEIDDIRMKALLGDEQFAKYKRASSIRSFGVSFLTLGIAELASAVILIPVGVATGATYCWIYGWVSFAVGVVELPIGIVSMAVNTGRLNHIADGYNQKNYSENMSISLYPTLVSSTEAAGERCVAPGLGFSLNF